MSGSYIEVDGVPAEEPDLMKWATEFRGADRTVKKTTIGDILVSTVFLGLDHQWGEGPPLLYETMVFGGDFDEICERFSTRDGAILGHQQVVDLVRTKMGESE